jgi:hypothetical protein
LTRARAIGRATAAAAIGLAALVLAGCGPKPPPPRDAATERSEALERARQGPYGGQVKSLDTARDLEADINKKAQEQVDNIEKNAK